MDDIRKALERIARGMAVLLEQGRPGLPLVLTVKAAAMQLSVSERTMRTLVASGEVPSVLVGGRRMVPSAELVKLAQPVVLDAVRKERAARRIPRGHGLNLADELQELADVKRRRARG